ncbi:beta-galactosidase 15-like [Herrania umbratica]|uniref:Beta-galactosidase n=1 Tax=Herrania umbratica TaxID=108875 RepID=A0A6J1BIT4_9ROSI|nr:beta-galactosidase 15-like [Herrania umbratica]
MEFFKSLFAAIIISFFLFQVNATNVTHDGRSLIIDGVHRVLISGSIHYPRSTAQMWPDLIRKAKEGGLDTIETYVFWNAHEPIRRQYDFSGNLDLIRFIKTIQDEGLYAVLRIGPYVCAEWNYGGFPVWLHNLPGVSFRTKNDVFMNEMQNFTTLIVDMVKNENLFASQGGPIILAQIENEFGNVMGPYGAGGKEYIQWCSNMAESLGVGVPWIMCQQQDAPKPMINTCNGFYCDEFKPNNPSSPKMWTENWTGWFKSWGGADPYRTAEDLAYSVARFYQKGGTFQNYYMYHGGTNFGRTSGGPYITTTYDYNAPLDEYGNPNQPKWGHLKQLHDVLHSMEYTLTHGDVTNTDLGNSISTTLYSTKEKSSCFLSNAHNQTDAVVKFGGIDYYLPAWSVSILPDCKDEAYNTAKVYAQTSVLVKKPNKAEDEPNSLEWVWRPENIERTAVQGKGDHHANRIIDQKAMANDASDYLWYMTRVELPKDDPLVTGKATLRVTDSGHVLHAYVNGEYIGSQWAQYGSQKYVFEKEVKLNPGKNLISLLSATVGLQNYGPMFDLNVTGVLSPVELVAHKGNGKVVKDLSSHKWSYKVGLDGVANKLYETDCPSKLKWSADSLPVDRNMTWYKTTFKAPLGNAPVVVDLLGLGKGHAWVNGHSLGRYWPSYIADEHACQTAACDYRGAYSDKKCVSKCGEPTQRWYHVPRSFLKDGENTLVLFEEFGGNPSGVQFQTVEIGTACINAHEGKKVALSCHNRPISRINFASFGDPQGVCGSFKKTECESTEDAVSILEKECVGKESCSFEISEDKFGKAYCAVKRLAVEAVC